MRVLVQLNSNLFVLRDPAVVATVRSDIEAAVRAGGAFVRIGPEGSPEILVTPSTPVRIENISDSDAITTDEARGTDEFELADLLS